MLFRFTGTYTGGRTSIRLYGAVFEGREPADVLDPDGIRRLSGHPEFEVVSEPKGEPVIQVTEIAPGHFYAAPKPRGRPKKGK